MTKRKKATTKRARYGSFYGLNARVAELCDCSPEFVSRVRSGKAADTPAARKVKATLKTEKARIKDEWGHRN